MLPQFSLMCFRHFGTLEKAFLVQRARLLQTYRCEPLLAEAKDPLILAGASVGRWVECGCGVVHSLILLPLHFQQNADMSLHVGRMRLFMRHGVQRLLMLGLLLT